MTDELAAHWQTVEKLAVRAGTPAIHGSLYGRRVQGQDEAMQALADLALAIMDLRAAQPPA